MKKGFTLVELSIVLVIIGLLIGGILVAQSMIETARIASQIKQFQQYDIALTNFQQKFNALPGDSSKEPSTNNYVGNDDKVLTDFVGFVPMAFLWGDSSSYFTTLSQYGFITENYRMVHSVIDVGEGSPYPETVLNRDGSRAMLATSNTGGEVFYYVGLNIAGVAYHTNATIASYSPNGVMSSTQALALDKKFDDGLPQTGNIVATTSARNATVGALYPTVSDTATCATSTAYNVANTSNTNCRLLVKAKGYK